MKHSFILVLFLAFASISFGQKPAADPTPGPSPLPETTRTKTFGSSLEKFEKKKKQNSPNIQKTNQTDEEDVIRVETDLVVHDVLVTDQKGNVITGLRKDDFVVTEDGTSQGIEMFSSGETATVPRSMVLVIDNDLLQIPYLKMSIVAAKTLVDKLGPQDKMAIVTAHMILRQDFTADKTILKHTLDDVEKKGFELARWYTRGAKLDDLSPEDAMEYPRRRSQFHALMAVLNEMFDEKGRQRIIVFQGDGVHVMWLKTDKDAPYPVSYSTRMNSGMKYTGEAKSMSKFGFSEVKEAIESSRVTIYSVATGIRFFGLPEKERMARARISWENMGKAHGWKNNYPPDVKRMYEDREDKTRTAGQAAMYRVAEISGGNTAMMEKPEDAERIYAAIFATIKSRYVIGYYPTDSKLGERRRNVKIEVRGHPEYIIDGRKTYILQ